MYRYYLHDKTLPSGGAPIDNLNMAATTETAKIRNLESSILFLQQEHAETLKCLHDEIRTLQKKNKDLTFRVEMGRDVVHTADTPEEKIRSLTAELDATRAQLDNSNSDKERKIQSLEKQLKVQEKAFRDELKTYSSKFRKCQQELQNKADTIAELQHKLYSVNKELATRRSSDTPLVPTPPKEGAPRVRRNSRKVVPVEVQTIERPRSSSSGSLRREYVIDPSPFLIRDSSPRDQDVLVQKRQHDPLPPISSQDRDQSPVPPRRPEAEVVQLALGSVQKNETWRHAPSHSSNFK